MNLTCLENGLTFEINVNNFKAKIIHSPKLKENIIIPNTITYQSKEFKTSIIGEDSFKKNRDIKSIDILEDSELVTIEKNAFYCSSIKELYIPASLIELQEGWCAYTWDLIHVSISPKNNFYTLYNNKLILGKSDPKKDNYDTIVFACRDITQASIPSSIKYINSCAFMCCTKLKMIEISDESELESIEPDTFTSSSIESINIPPKVETIKDSWCKSTFSLKKVSISPKNRYFKYMNESTEKVIIGKSDKNSDVYDTIFFSCRDIEKVTIPSQIKHITSFSFQQCRSLTEITFEEKSMVETIGEHAFSNTIIERITIPSTVHQLGDFSFSHCLLLQKVDLSKSSNIETISKGAFYGTSIQSIFIPSSVKRIEEKAFFHCVMLSRIEFSKDSELISIEKEAFSQTSIQKFIIPKHVKNIGENCFANYNVNLTVDFENESEIESFNSKSFSSDWLVNLTIPEKVKKLNKGWCRYTLNLNSISISPKNRHFSYLDKNKKVITTKPDNSEDFCTIVFACRNIESIVIPSHIECIDSYCFSDCKKLNSIEFEKNPNLVSINDFAFYNSAIERILIPSSVEIIGDSAFSNCKSLNRIFFSDDSDLISIGKKSFENSNINNICIPKNVNRIGCEAFSICDILSFVEILSDQICLENKCFHYCSNLYLISFPNAKNVYIQRDEFNGAFKNTTFFTLAKSNIIISN